MKEFKPVLTNSLSLGRYSVRGVVKTKISSRKEILPPTRISDWAPSIMMSCQRPRPLYNVIAFISDQLENRFVIALLVIALKRNTNMFCHPEAYTREECPTVHVETTRRA